MRNIFKLASLLLVFVAVSCTTVAPGHKGVKVSWGGETDMSQVYPEGMHSGISWIWNSMEEYDVREHTMVREFEFNDANDMLTVVKIALDYRLSPAQVNQLHVGINDVEVKIETSLSSAAKEVVPQYGAVDLNKHKRVEGEKLLTEILKEELPEFYVEFKRVRFTDIGIPPAVSKLAEETAVQIGRNELAEKKEAEQIALAKAKVAKAQGDLDAERLNDETKRIQSKPQYLELFKAQTERIWAEKGTSPWGNNNVFGTSSAAVVKGLK